MEPDGLKYGLGHTGGLATANQVKVETVTERLQRVLNRAQSAASLSDKIAFRVAGPRPQPIADSGVAPSHPDDGIILSRLAEQLEETFRQIEHNLEYAHARV